MVPVDPPEVSERFESALDLADSIARQVRRATGQSAALEELVSYGQEGLLDAARRYDPERGVPFRAYASYRVRGAILDGLRAASSLPRRVHERLRALEASRLYSEGAVEDVHAPVARGAGPAEAERALSDHLAAMATAMAVGLVAPAAHGEHGARTTASQADSPEQAVAQAELLALVREHIAELPAEEAELVRRHYLEGERFDAVARDLGLSKSWASRLHTRAIGRLSKRLRGASG
ncbi:MAG: sigma-70 family RNA polymerase sigma factor [Polyangiaceae bacterium]|nr:sigma-70 family RNA polymerase sigma factor [Polyangiaceae bacterium]